MSTPNHDNDFPWHLGVHDAHCHPTDTMASIASIPDMKAASLTVMSTRGQDQDLVLQIAQSISPHNPDINTQENPPKVLPCFGWHPWFAHQIYDDTNTTTTTTTTTTNPDLKTTHYTQVLTPPPTSPEFISSLPTPKPLSQLLSETRTRLTSHPTSLIGEIGLDRSFRLPNPWTAEEEAARDPHTTPGSREGRTLSPHRVQMEHQKVVLEAQLRLAGELGRPVSVHSVQAHGLVVTLLRGLWAGHERKKPSRRERRRRYSAADAHADSDAEAEGQEEEEEGQTTQKPAQPLPFPPRICMHSYSGPTEPLKQFLDPTNPSDVYFSFSAVINFSGPSSAKVIAVIKALPDDRILVESDLHTAGSQMDELLEKVTRQVCELREWPLEEGVRRLAGNWRRFVFG
ncbi:Metallo-dependent hydrolase [Aspergillus taichungensis]|uniref:Metallo-dependent hydrolase n=1 Tax=Aspergillus taichungensis TaxID=482145 RepID=A0A2J5I3J8_9EURO|nr:Metallo-dependent hydrolase [Aspergillus taichungensis]